MPHSGTQNEPGPLSPLQQPLVKHTSLTPQSALVVHASSVQNGSTQPKPPPATETQAQRPPPHRGPAQLEVEHVADTTWAEAGVAVPRINGAA